MIKFMLVCKRACLSYKRLVVSYKFINLKKSKINVHLFLYAFKVLIFMKLVLLSKKTNDFSNSELLGRFILNVFTFEFHNIQSYTEYNNG